MKHKLDVFDKRQIKLEQTLDLLGKTITQDIFSAVKKATLTVKK